MFPRVLSHTPAGEFYRVEPGFLIQGSMRSFIPPNKVTKKGPKIMEKGEAREIDDFSFARTFLPSRLRISVVEAVCQEV